jgi:hypothetical protein
LFDNTSDISKKALPKMPQIQHSYDSKIVKKNKNEAIDNSYLVNLKKQNAKRINVLNIKNGAQ